MAQVSANPQADLKEKIRRAFLGGSDARIIMGDDDAALLRLWREKRGEDPPQDLTDNPIVQLGLATETSIGSGMSARAATRSPRCSTRCATRSSASSGQPSTA